MSNPLFLFKPSSFGIIQMSTFILVELLLIFGKQFSKFHLFGPFHLADTCLLILAFFACISFLMRQKIILVKPVIALIAISLLYLSYSYFAELGPLNYLIRQFALFVYLICLYLIFFSYADDNTNRYNVNFLILVGVVAAALQIGYHFYNLLAQSHYPSKLFVQFNYFSLLGFMAIFLFEATVLVYLKRWWKWPLAAAVLLLLFTMGHHSSALLTFLAVAGAYSFLRSNWSLKIPLIMATVIVPILLFKFVPSYFQDHNSMWRLIYWKYSLKDIFLNYYGVLGHGFGVKYVNQEILDALRNQINSPWMDVRPEEQYLSPMHNSFITIAFHVGFVFLIFLVLPLRNALKYMIDRGKNNPTLSKDFLIISLIGVSVWSCFHVVLELPHSSSFFWLIYFSTIYVFNYSSEDKINSKT